MTWDRWERIDAVVAITAFVALTAPALAQGDSSAGAIVGFGAATTLPLAARRRRPLEVLAVVGAATAVGTAAGVHFTPFGSNLGVGVALAMYTVAVRLGRRLSLGALAVTVPVMWVAAGIAYRNDRDQNAVHVVAAVAGWVAGELVRLWRAQRAEAAGRQLAEERLRLSREVHDVVSHSLSVIAVQAGVGRMVFATQPDQARNALVEIEQLSRSALDELRRILTAARDDEPARAPLPGLGDLPALVETMRANGLAVTLAVEGSPEEAPEALPSGLGRSAYRIVQEALTNVVKHAPGATVQVRVRSVGGDVLIEVVDDGPRAPRRLPAGAGWGIAGMQERAALFGGTVEAGPRPEGGFAVVARLPVDEAVRI
jgi:signal transduction histidine kinase